MTFNDIIRLYGGHSGMAKYFNVSRRAIWEWSVKKVPIKYLPRFITELGNRGMTLNLDEINDIFRQKPKRITK